MKATLSKETILENKSASLWYYPDQKIIHHKVHQYLFGDPFRELLTKGADYFEKHHCICWLSDDRLNSALRQDDMDWGVVQWTPRVIQAGWKYWAILMPDKSVGKLSMKKLIALYKSMGVETEIFDDENEALDWLMSKVS